MRDLETVATALTAAETGHLILSSLHTNDAVQSVHRIVDVFPSGQQEQIRQQLALSLHAVISQHLLPRSRRQRPRAGGRARARDAAGAASHPERAVCRRSTPRSQSRQRIGMLSLEGVARGAAVREGGRRPARKAEARSGRPDELRSLLGAPPAGKG
jgi:twitching motility protein PilT